LLGTYARADLIAALERAVRYGAYSHAAVERILWAQARPKSILEALAEEERRLPPWLAEDLVSPRLTSSYQYLCESEPHDEEKPHTTSGDARSDGAAPPGPGRFPGDAPYAFARATRRGVGACQARGDVAPVIRAGLD